ncbi:dihydrofolate reductase family protein [Nocardioides sp. Bht2]|uniref:dihydrofolate reductase family protein n=1 Tax=Nocardioides sp. Bht2 TaxID=3392297 RepID=UPI0039B5D982
MGHLIYAAIGSLDGFIADKDGDFSFCRPSAEMHAYLNARDRRVSADLYGRRLYQVMQFWETFAVAGEEISPGAASDPLFEVSRAYGELWRGRDKVVFSTTLDDVDTARTGLVNHFSPAAVRQFVDDQPGDVSIGGPTLAAQALRAGIVDRIEYYAFPVVIGAGTHWLPAEWRHELRLIEEHRFLSGVVHTAYEVARSG